MSSAQATTSYLRRTGRSIEISSLVVRFIFLKERKLETRSDGSAFTGDEHDIHLVQAALL